MLSKSPIYTSKVRDALTPPSKFRSTKSRHSPAAGNIGGVASASATTSAAASASNKKFVNFEGEDDKRADSAVNMNMRVPESPPPPPRHTASTLNWGAMRDSLQQQVSN